MVHGVYKPGIIIYIVKQKLEVLRHTFCHHFCNTGQWTGHQWKKLLCNHTKQPISIRGGYVNLTFIDIFIKIIYSELRIAH